MRDRYSRGGISGGDSNIGVSSVYTELSVSILKGILGEASEIQTNGTDTIGLKEDASISIDKREAVQDIS